MENVNVDIEAADPHKTIFLREAYVPEEEGVVTKTGRWSSILLRVSTSIPPHTRSSHTRCIRLNVKRVHVVPSIGSAHIPSIQASRLLVHNLGYTPYRNHGVHAVDLRC